MMDFYLIYDENWRCRSFKQMQLRAHFTGQLEYGSLLSIKLSIITSVCFPYSALSLSLLFSNCE